jgi:hypothetical protein
MPCRSIALGYGQEGPAPCHFGVSATPPIHPAGHAAGRCADDTSPTRASCRTRAPCLSPCVRRDPPTPPFRSRVPWHLCPHPDSGCSYLAPAWPCRGRRGEIDNDGVARRAVGMDRYNPPARNHLYPVAGPLASAAGSRAERGSSARCPKLPNDTTSRLARRDRNRPGRNSEP